MGLTSSTCFFLCVLKMVDILHFVRILGLKTGVRCVYFNWQVSQVSALSYDSWFLPVNSTSTKLPNFWYSVLPQLKNAVSIKLQKIPQGYIRLCFCVVLQSIHVMWFLKWSLILCSNHKHLSVEMVHSPPVVRFALKLDSHYTQHSFKVHYLLASFSWQRFYKKTVKFSCR